jgi:hypothetical protein
MSDVSVLSHEYWTASELSKALNNDLITLKKVRLGLPGAEDISTEQVDLSRRRLEAITLALRCLLDSAGADCGDGVLTPLIPAALVVGIRAKRRGDLPYFLEDLERVAARLTKGTTDLTEADLTILDQLVASADGQRSSVYRRLMRN